MSGVLVPLVLGGLVLLGLTVAQAVLARRRRAALARGGEAAFRVRLGGRHAPYPQRPRRGVLRVGDGTLTWEAKGGGAQLDLSSTGVRPIGVRDPQRGDGATQHDRVLAAADGVGTPLRLVGLPETIDDLHQLLREHGVPSAPVPPVVVRAARERPALALPALLVALGLLGAGFTAWTLLTGVEVTGTVVSEADADGYCDVRWTDPRDGSVQVNGVECYHDPGEQASMLALAQPLRGEVVAADDPGFWAAVSGVLVAGGVGLPLWRRRQRRLDALAPDGPRLAPATPVELTADQLGHDDVAAAMRLRARAEGWSFEPDPGSAEPQPWAARSPRRRLLVAVASTAWPLLLAAFFAMLVGWTSVAGLWATTGPTATVTAQVTDSPFETIPFGPADLEVTFPLRDGGTETTLVAVRGLPDPTPTTLPVEYSLRAPDRARALEHDGRARGAGLAALLLAGGAGFAGWRTWRIVSTRRAERRARADTGRLRRYVLVPDHVDGTCLLLLYPDDLHGRPELAVALAEDPRGRIRAAGTALVRGPWGPGEVVVVLVDGRELLTSSPLFAVEEEDLLDLVNATDPLDA